MTKRRTNGSKKNAKKPRDDQAVPEPVVPEEPRNVQPPAPISLPGIPFRLPVPTLEQVFGSLSPMYIISFALSSVTSYNFLNNNVRVRATRVQFFNRPDEDSTNFQIIIQMPNYRPCILETRIKSLGIERENQKRLPIEKVWGRDVMIQVMDFNGSNWIQLLYDKRHDARMVAMETFNLFKNVFNTTNIELMSLSTKRDNDFSSFARRIRKFSKVGIRWHTPGCMNLEELQHVLGTLSADAMYLNVFLPRLKYTGPINKRILQAQNASWLTRECLLNMTCETLIVSGTKLTVNDINMFVKEWQTNLEKLGNLELIRMEQHDRFPLDPEELCLEKWPPRGTNVEVPYPESTWYCKRGDLLATLELRNGNKVMFCVWHEKYLSRRDNHYEEATRVQSLWPDWIIS